MLETVYHYTLTDKKVIEKIVDDDHAAINHIVLPRAEALPEHETNSNVYLIILRGVLTLRLANQEARVYTAGNIVAIPYKVKMNLSNTQEEPLEFCVVKAPSPTEMMKRLSGK
jgi:quercetin dioxygenase-like cupin family protein